MFTTSWDSSSSSLGLYSAHFCSLIFVAVRALSRATPGMRVGVLARHNTLFYKVEHPRRAHLRVNAEVMLLVKRPQARQQRRRRPRPELDGRAIRHHLGSDTRQSAGARGPGRKGPHKTPPTASSAKAQGPPVAAQSPDAFQTPASDAISLSVSRLSASSIASIMPSSSSSCIGGGVFSTKASISET